MRPGEVGNAPVAPRQVSQNLPARGIGQRGKGSVQCSRRIFNHLVNYFSSVIPNVQIFFVAICGSGSMAAISARERFFVHDVRHFGRIAAVVGV